MTHLKRAVRINDEQRKPLAQYRHEELEEMKRNFWGEDRSYHMARTAFVRKQARQGGLQPGSGSVASYESTGASTRSRLAYDTTGWSSTIGSRE